MKTTPPYRERGDAMKRNVIALVVGLVTALVSSAYIGYVETALKAASELRWDKQYAESARRLERLLPYVWISHYRSQVMLKLAFNYRDLSDHESLREIAIRLEQDYPDTVAGYYGLKFQGDYLRDVKQQYDQAIALYNRILTKAQPRRAGDVLHVVREDTLYELARLYFRTGDRMSMNATLERLKEEYPASPYLELARKEFR